MSAIPELSAVVIDCREAAAMATFYHAACGGEITRMGGGSAWLTVGGVTVIFREVEGYQPPTWPASDVPMQIHLDFSVEDLDRAEKLLHEHGATTAGYQPHPDKGRVMLDPAGHPFCIGKRG